MSSNDMHFTEFLVMLCKAKTVRLDDQKSSAEPSVFSNKRNIKDLNIVQSCINAFELINYAHSPTLEILIANFIAIFLLHMRSLTERNQSHSLRKHQAFMNIP